MGTDRSRERVGKAVKLWTLRRCQRTKKQEFLIFPFVGGGFFWEGGGGG